MFEYRSCGHQNSQTDRRRDSEMQGREESDAHPGKERIIQGRYAQRSNPDAIVLRIIDGALPKIYEI